MSLLKIPLLLPSVWLFNISLTSPNPPPDNSERVYGTWYESYILPNIFPILYKLSASIPCAAELAINLAVDFPSRLSSEVISRLVVAGQLPTSGNDRYFISGCILVAVGGLGRLWCYRSLGRHFTAQLSVRKDHKLVVTGPYAIVRHPSYLFMIPSSLGMSLLIAGPSSFVRRCGWLDTTLGKLFVGAWAAQTAFLWMACFSRCQREDAFLRERFRGEWERYSERVRYRMIPGVY